MIYIKTGNRNSQINALRDNERCNNILFDILSSMIGCYLSLKIKEQKCTCRKVKEKIKEGKHT